MSLGSQRAYRDPGHIEGRSHCSAVARDLSLSCGCNGRAIGVMRRYALEGRPPAESIGMAPPERIRAARAPERSRTTPGAARGDVDTHARWRAASVEAQIIAVDAGQAPRAGPGLAHRRFVIDGDDVGRQVGLCGADGRRKCASAAYALDAWSVLGVRVRSAASISGRLRHWHSPAGSTLRDPRARCCAAPAGRCLRRVLARPPCARSSRRRGPCRG
jgi:hypothetical protein